MIQLIIITHCQDCPCINTSEYGEMCNLGFDLLERPHKAFDGLRKNIPKNWHYMSFNCRLHSIQKTDIDGDWKPERIEIEEK